MIVFNSQTCGNNQASKQHKDSKEEEDGNLKIIICKIGEDIGKSK
jgi:hypothetical protein